MSPNLTPLQREAAWPQLLSEIRGFLPQQNPLASFLHNNMLMAWEKDEFWAGVKDAAALHGAEVPRPIRFYFKAWEKGTLSPAALRQSLWDELEGRGPCPSVGTRSFEGIYAAVTRAPAAPLSTLGQMLPHRAAAVGAERSETETWVFSRPPEGPPEAAAPFFPPEVWHWLCRLLESFLDQGLSLWANPYQGEGLLAFVRAWGRSAWVFDAPWQRELVESLPRDGARAFILEKWEASGLKAEAFKKLCLRLLYQVKGWAGMLQKCESEPGVRVFRPVKAELEELLALLLLLIDKLGIAPQSLMKEEAPRRKQLFQLRPDALRSVLGQLLRGSAPKEGSQDLERFAAALKVLDEATMQKVWHVAYEASFHRASLLRLGQHQGARFAAQREELAPSLQMLCCMDDREESFRRHIEEVEPTAFTYGVLGNFGIDMRFQGPRHPRPRQQCPPVVQPRRLIRELAPGSASRAGLLMQRLRSASFASSRSLVGGLLASVSWGPLAFGAIFLEVLHPRLNERLRRVRAAADKAPAATSFSLSREDHPNLGPLGYSLEEQAAIVASVLAPLLPCRSWAPVLVAMAHESSSRNNPFRQAYGCGACSGNSGAPNARVFAAMANHPEVRELLRRHGIDLPDSTRVIPAVHDTSRDLVRYLGTDEAQGAVAPASLALLESTLDRALRRNAQERCRRFLDQSRMPSLSESWKHVQTRALSPAEVRPEYGHAGTYLAVFGRRELTRGLSLDRRAFLVSYDQRSDGDGKVLEGLLHGAMPVVANITLDYFFSALDHKGFGAASKLPLNVSGLLGVLTGAQGDLRIGLTQQMVEVHEPVRALVLVEAEPERVESLVMRHPRLERLVTRGWMRLGVIEENGSAIRLWTAAGWKTEFSIPKRPAARGEKKTKTEAEAS